MRLAVAGVALLLVASYIVLRDGDDPVRTSSPGRTPAGTAAKASGESPTPSPSATATSTTPSPSASPASTGRPPTLAFVLVRNSYITVRVPGGRTLVSKLFRKGQKASFDRKVLQVVNGRPSAVRFTVNGKPRKPGPASEPESFTVRRR